MREGQLQHTKVRVNIIRVGAWLLYLLTLRWWCLLRWWRLLGWLLLGWLLLCWLIWLS